MKIVSNKPTITRKELEGVLDCLINDELRSGMTVKNFETIISKMIGLKYPLAVNSLTAAYHLAFHALQLSADDEVIIPSYFNHAPLSALNLIKATPVLIDNDQNSIFPSVDSIKERITDKTKAIVIGHLFGIHYPIEELKELKVPVIEDISHCIGTEIDEEPAGSGGTFTVTSFDPSCIITTGNGGMVLTNNSKFYSTMRDYRGNVSTLNMDYAMTDIQGAMGISQLIRLQNFLKRRREIARIYHDSLKMTSHKTPYQFNESFAYQSFPVLFDATQEKINSHWKKNRVELLRPVETPLHAMLGYNNMDYPNCERLSKKLYTVPLYPTLSRKDIEKISKTLAGFI